MSAVLRPVRSGSKLVAFFRALAPRYAHGAPRRFAASRAAWFAPLAALALGACAAPDDAPSPIESTGKAAEAIDGGTTASAFFAARSAAIPGCTATQIAPDFVLTAAHCVSQVGDAVTFYNGNIVPDASTRRHVTKVLLRAGVHPASGDLDNSNGDFSDFAILKLDESFTGASIATMNWVVPQEGAVGEKVGQGLIDGEQNPSHLLSMVKDTFDVDEDDGSFRSTNDQVDPGDSGGGFFVNGKLTGDLWGWVWAFGPGTRDKYTNIPFHLNAILDLIDYKWPGNAPQANVVRAGNVIESDFLLHEQVCQYACEHTSSCVAYNFLEGAICQLLSSVDSKVTNVLPSSSASK